MIKVIAGKLNGLNVSNYWLINEKKVTIGDYVIVENKKGYDLVEVTGILETDEEHINQIIGNQINKKVIYVIPKKVWE